MVNGLFSTWRLVTNEALQGSWNSSTWRRRWSALLPRLQLMGWECWYVRAAIQKDLDRLKKWPDGNFMHFNKDVQKVQQLGMKSPPCSITCWGWLHRGSSTDTAIGKVAESSCTRAPWPQQQWGPTAGTGASREVIRPLCSALVRPHLDYWG